MKTIQAVLFQRNKKDRAGIIKIRVTENRKHSYVSTDQKLEARLWNTRYGKVKETAEVDYEHINQVVAEKLAEVRAVHTENAKASSTASFIEYFEKVIGRQSNEGTKIKYGTILAKMVSYLEHEGMDDLPIKKFTEDIVNSMRSFFLKKMQEDTADHYLKVIRGGLKKAVRENVHNYVRPPFTGVELKGESTKAPNCLTGDQLKKIIGAKVDDPRVENHRRAFLFQVFTQGMRLSDLLVLRWNNFKDGRLDYVMLKTGRKMSIGLNDNLVELLRPIAELYAMEGKLIIDTIDRLSANKEFKNRFVFGLLKDEEFSGVGDRNDFSRIGKAQYVRLNKRSIVYNRNLKDVQRAAEIKTTLNSHCARHAFASLLLDGDVNLYAISKSLNHSNIKITEKYISHFRTTKLDDINYGLVSRFRL